MKEDIEVNFEKRLNEAISSWLKKGDNYPEKGKLDLEFKESSIPKIIGQFNFEDILIKGKTLLSIKVIASYWFRFAPGAKVNSHNYEWTINNLAVLWIYNDYDFNFECIDSFAYLLNN
jgi:hypothetical protein